MTSSSQKSAEPAGPWRLHALDALRAIAVLGMIYMHVSPTGWFEAVPFADKVPVLAWLESMFTGRAMSLFVLMAGISVALMTGGSRPHGGARLKADRQRLAIRAAVLFIISLAVDQFTGNNLSILEYYTLWLLVLIPVVRLRPRVLFTAAAVLAVAMPLFCFIVLNFGKDWAISPFSGGGQATVGLALLWHPGDWLLKLKQLLVGGGFQTPYALPLLLAGLAIGRLELSSARVVCRLAVTGAVMAGGAWLLSRFALGPLGAADALAAMMSSGSAMSQPWISLLTLPPHQLYALSMPMAPFMFGVGLLLFSGLSALLQRPTWQRLLVPLTTCGRLALTWYAAHLVFIESVAGEPPYAFALFAGIMIFAFVFSVLWLRRFTRGPLESLMHRAGRLLVPGRKLARAQPS